VTYKEKIMSVMPQRDCLYNSQCVQKRTLCRRK